MSTKISIAVDGPSGAGKSTIAKAVAGILDIDYIDTGAMYRAVGYKLLKEGVALDDKPALEALLARTDIDFTAGKIILDGADVGDKIRTSEISSMASACSALAPVREKLVRLQQKMAHEKSVIMDGRDIGTNVLTGAEYKFFLTASAEERARRRHLELAEKGMPDTYEQVLSDIRQRDRNDTTRALNPLKKAAGAIELDTTDMTIEEVVKMIVEEVKKDGDC